MERKVLYERFRNYITINELKRQIYDIEEYIEEKKFSTEEIIIKYPRKTFVQNLIGKTKHMFVKVLDVNTIDNHRIINFYGDTTTAYKFIFYDDDRKIVDVKKDDKIDIIVRIDKIDYAQQTIRNTFFNQDEKIEVLSIYFSILDLEKNWYNFQARYDKNDHRLD